MSESATTTCLFCKIVAGEIPATVVRRTDRVVAFRDIDPKAPTHILVIPTTHLADAAEVAAHDPALLGELIAVAADLAAEDGIAESGYRLVLNTGKDGGQTVFHAHVHLLGGTADELAARLSRRLDRGVVGDRSCDAGNILSVPGG